MSRQETLAQSELLSEYATLEYILLGDLRDLLEEPADEATCRWLLVVLEALLDTLPRQFELEEDGGYLSQVLEEYPTWYPMVDQLQQEHGALYATLRQLYDRVARHAPFVEIADQLKCELRDWMNRLIAHNRHENRLVQTALNLDVGTGD